MNIRHYNGKNQKITALILVAAALVIIVLVFFFQRGVDSTRISGGAYNYFGEQRVSYSGTVKLQHDDKTNLTKASYDGGSETLDSTPLYDGDGVLTIPYAYSYYDLESGFIYRLEHFSTARITGSGVELTDADRSKSSARGFLYDGVDTYIFLEDAELDFGEGDSIRVPALSYAVARYGNTLQYYRYDASGGSSTVVHTGETPLLARFDNGDVLNMGTDSLSKRDGTSQLLIVVPQVLDRMD